MSLSDAFDRPAIKSATKPSSWSGPSIGTPERDFADNGWPSETVARIMDEGLRHGRGSNHWTSAMDPDAPHLLLASLPTPTGSIALLLDPSSSRVAVQGPGGLRSEGTDFEALAAQIATASHRFSEPSRAQDPVAHRAGMWQSNASIALSAASFPEAALHPKPGANAQDAWDADFERISALCESAPNPVAAMDRVRSAYLGSSEKDMSARVSAAISSQSSRSMIGGESAAIVALGAKGCEIRAAIPLRSDGSVNKNTPIIALVGSLDSEGSFRGSGEPLRFYNAQALSSFAASATRQEIAALPIPDIASKLAARRANAPAAPAPTTTSAPSLGA